MNYIENKYREEDVDGGKLVFGAIKGMTEALQEAYDDPYSQFLPTDIYEETMELTASITPEIIIHQILSITKNTFVKSLP